MLFGLSDRSIQKLVSCFRTENKIDKVIIYGSRAKGNFKKGSDIDLVLIGDQLSTTDLLKIENRIEDLLLPFKVDVSLFHQINNEELLDHINRVGKPFYENSLYSEK